jgi:hypothetical protein
MLWWFAALRPGLMSADSLESWAQATGSPWIDLQPPLYTAAMWVSDALVGSPSLLTLGQSLLLASSIVATGLALVRVGTDRRIVVPLCAVVVCTPMVGAFSVSLWKDVPYTAALMFVVARLIDLAGARAAGDDLAARSLLRPIAAWSALGVGLRQNGILVVSVLFVILWACLPSLRRRAVSGLLVSIAVLAVMRLVAYPLLDVQGGPANSQVSTFLHDVASVAGRDPGALDDGDRALLERVAPVQVWGDAWRRFGCYSANWQYSLEFDWRRIDGRQRDYVRLWLELLRENPRAVVGNRGCAGAVAWRPDNHGVLYTVSRGIDGNDLGLRTVPVVSGWNDMAVDVLDALDDPDVQWIAWRAPGWLYLTYVVVGAAAWRRRQPSLVLPLALPVSLQLSVAVLNPAQDARYLVAGLLAAWLVLPLASAPLGARATTADAEESRRTRSPEVVPT